MTAYAFKYELPDGADTRRLTAIAESLEAQEWLHVRLELGFVLFLFRKDALSAEELLRLVRQHLSDKPDSSADPEILQGDAAVRLLLELAAGVRPGGGVRERHARFRRAYTRGCEAGHAGPLLNHIHQQSVWLQEKIRLETDFFSHAMERETVAAGLAEKIFGQFDTLSVHALGADASARKHLDELRRRGCRHFTLWYGEQGRAASLSELALELDATVRSLEADGGQRPVGEVIYLFAASTADVAWLRRGIQRRLRRDKSPMLVCDFSGNRVNLGRERSVYLYRQRDLDQIIEKNAELQQQGRQACDRLIADEAAAFLEWADSDARHHFAGLIGSTPEMARIFETISRVSQTGITVLIEGESGTGKELVARAVHDLSRRAGKRFMAINCGALPEQLLESELFGHVRGAFTGAIADKHGLFQVANGGTVFLDEVAELSPRLQVALLRFLQEGEIKPVGSNETLSLDVRVLAATNKHLGELVDEGAFRSDLYYRLNVLQLTLPPLRERQADIALLTRHFLKKFSARFQKEVHGIEDDALQALRDHAWPGNVRELENIVERAVALTMDSTISRLDLPEALRKPSTPLPALGSASLRDVEKAHILTTLERLAWNYDDACKVLGIGRTTLWRKLKEYGVRK